MDPTTDNRKPEELKDIVKQKYGEIAGEGGAESCCSGGCGCGDGGLVVNFADSYEGLPGYVPDADMGLGCGLPTEHAGIEAGMTVLDLGSGAGNDAFVARALVGEEGRVIGVDMTAEMIDRANENLARLKHGNVEFRLGEIETLPVADDTVDVVVSNCVLNLVPDKGRAYREIHRVLKPGGRFCISDIVLDGELPPALLQAAEAYAGCVAGAMQRSAYEQAIKEAGFPSVETPTSHRIDLPDAMLAQILPPEELQAFRDSCVGVFSVTVVGIKP